MLSKYIQEQKRYTQRELGELLEEKSEETLLALLRKLKEYGIVKLVKANDAQKNRSDLLEADIEAMPIDMDNEDCYYVFTFVGVIIIADKVLKCYPKYILSNQEPKKELKQIIKVLEKYNSKEQIIHMYNGDSDTRAFNLLALQLFLLKDYYEYGLYTNTNDILETNGEGEIFWDKTINETFALLQNNRPYYLELKTKKNVENQMDFFKKLHEIILSRISKELKNRKESVMVSGINSSSVAVSGNLSVLKKAMETEEVLMSSIINGMQNTQATMQTSQAPAQSTPLSQSQPSSKLDIMA